MLCQAIDRSASSGTIQVTLMLSEPSSEHNGVRTGSVGQSDTSDKKILTCKVCFSREMLQLLDEGVNAASLDQVLQSEPDS